MESWLSKLGDEYYNAIKDCIYKGRLYVSARRGVVTLILKKGHDLFEVKNWRPICLLNADYKIFSKA